MDNNTLLFQDKGSGRYKDVKIYPNRIEVLKKGTFGGKHTEIVYLKDITGVNRIKGRDVFLRNRLLRLIGQNVCPDRTSVSIH